MPSTSAKPKIPCLRRADIREIHAERLRHRQKGADRRVRRCARLRLALLVLLVGVARQPRTVGDILLAEAGLSPETPEVGGELARVVTPGTVLGAGTSCHSSRIDGEAHRYGLIRMATIQSGDHSSLPCLVGVVTSAVQRCEAVHCHHEEVAVSWCRRRSRCTWWMHNKLTS